MDKTLAIVAGAGRGRRMESALSKQYLPLGGKPIIARTLSVLEGSPLVAEIRIAVAPGDCLYCQKEIVERFQFTKVKKLVEGGVTRQDSVYLVLQEVEPEFEFVLVQDAVRPFLELELVAKLIEEAGQHAAAVAAIPVKDTVKEAAGEGFVHKTLARERLWAIQTPQVFRRELLLEAYRKACEDGFAGTDDASLVERTGHQVRMVEGSPTNIKITTPQDLVMGEALLREKRLNGW